MFPLPESPRSSHFIVLDHFSSYLSQPDKVQKGVKLLPGPSQKLPLLNFFERKYFELHFGAQISWSTHVLHESRVQHDLKNAEFVFFKRKCYEKPGKMQSALGMLPDLFLSSPHTFFFKKMAVRILLLCRPASLNQLILSVAVIGKGKNRCINFIVTYKVVTIRFCGLWWHCAIVVPLWWNDLFQTKCSLFGILLVRLTIHEWGWGRE